MIQYTKETYQTVRKEIEDLIVKHYEEIALNKEHVPLVPDWQGYKNLEDKGLLAIIGARDNGKLIGYSIFFIKNHIHYNKTLFANNDVLFLLPEYRKGRTGINLIRKSEDYLKALGVTKVLWHIKVNNDFRLILHRMGYVDEDIMVGKILKD